MKGLFFLCLYVQILEKFSKSTLIFPKHSQSAHTFIPRFTLSSLFVVTKQQNASCLFKKKKSKNKNPRYPTCYLTVHIITLECILQILSKTYYTKTQSRKDKHILSIFKYMESSSIYKVLYGPLVFSEETDKFLRNCVLLICFIVKNIYIKFSTYAKHTNI